MVSRFYTTLVLVCSCAAAAQATYPKIDAIYEKTMSGTISGTGATESAKVQLHITRPDASATSDISIQINLFAKVEGGNSSDGSFYVVCPIIPGGSYYSGITAMPPSPDWGWTHQIDTTETVPSDTPANYTMHVEGAAGSFDTDYNFHLLESDLVNGTIGSGWTYTDNDPGTGTGGDTGGTGGTGLSDSDKSWIEQLFTVSDAKKTEFDNFRKRWQGMGPWGELSNVQNAMGSHLDTDEVVTDTVPSIPVWSGTHEFHIQNGKLFDWNNTSRVIGTSGDAHTPWNATTTLDGWIAVFRTILAWALYGICLMSFVSYLKGRISV